MKYQHSCKHFTSEFVALFTRAWIEISIDFTKSFDYRVALFTRAWIEMSTIWYEYPVIAVALFTRAWIEIICSEVRSPVE